jgi:hypothetical protein
MLWHGAPILDHLLGGEMADRLTVETPELEGLPRVSTVQVRSTSLRATATVAWVWQWPCSVINRC